MKFTNVFRPTLNQSKEPAMSQSTSAIVLTPSIIEAVRQRKELLRDIRGTQHTADHTSDDEEHKRLCDLITAMKREIWSKDNRIVIELIALISQADRA